MGKGNELWNDSVLIGAFDRAMATYKEMHKESYPGHSFADEKHASESNLGEDLHSASSTREEEHNDDQQNLIDDVANTCMPYCQDVATNEVLQSQEESLCANICTPELNPHSSKIPVADTETSYANDQRNIEYNNLLNQYYELEEKRQQVLQQLQHANYWNPQNPAQSGEYQAEKVLSNHANENYSQHPCSWCSCHGATVTVPAACVTCCPSSGFSDSRSQGCFVLAPHQFSDGQGYGQSNLCPSCSSCTVDAPKKINFTDDNLTKIGMKVAEKVLSSVISKFSLVSAGCEENEGKEEASGEHELKTSSGTEQESDLATVLSAWYSAGFHTGRYLSEQSRRKDL